MVETKKRANGFKLILALLSVLIIAVVALPLAACGSGDDEEDVPLGPIPEGSLRLTVNYLRPKADYTDWEMWLWAPTGAGGDYNPPYHFKNKTVNMAGFEWKTLTYDVPNFKANGEKSIGFIVRKPDWAAKDIEKDRFIPESMIQNGNEVTVYIAQARESIYSDAQTCADAATSNRIVDARFNKYNSLIFSTDKRITTKSTFKLKDGDGNVVQTIKGSSYKGKNVATVELSSDVDITKSYTLVDEPDAGFDKDVNFLSAKVNKAPIYSSAEFETKYKYDGVLGVNYSRAQSVFQVWSPIATEIKLNLYDAGEGGEATTHNMVKNDKGVWSCTESGDLNGKYYTYTVTAEGKTSEVVDPYARSAGKNGTRGMILDLDATDPTGWSAQNHPELESYSDAVIYEAHLRDLTVNPNSGVSAANRGKFLGMTEKGNKPLDYIKELGVTTVHFQPLFDFSSVDESFTEATYNKDGEFNWGYDPLNYNVPEGSYSSDPSDGAKRVNEMKQMVMALHNEGIQVVMDVVYNHVSNLDMSNFESLMPGYYFRTDFAGNPYNGSGCGNETASERYMFRKFMIDSVTYWTQEYDIDGFRFDLMALHDIDTMNAIYDRLASINPDVMIYGEGWTGGSCGLPKTSQALQENAGQMPHIAVFNDIVRDGMKGGVFNVEEIGFVSGNTKGKTDAAVYVGAAGATSAVDGSIYTALGKSAFASAPGQSVNYVSAHDNSTLWDKLNASVNANADTLKAMNRLAATGSIMSQGPSFFLAGEELLRGKPTEKDNPYDNRPKQYKTDTDHYFSDNSYKSSDSVNAIDWSLATTNASMISYYKGLIALKKSLPMFRISDAATLKTCLTVKDTALDDGVAVYAVKDPASDTYAIVILNATSAGKTVAVPNGSYNVYVKGDSASATPLETYSGSGIGVSAYSAVIMTATLDSASVSGWTYSVTAAA